MALFLVKKTKEYEQDSLRKKARTSLCNLLPSLKRKRSTEEEEEKTITKKKKVNTITRLFQKIILSSQKIIVSSQAIKRDRSELLFDALYTFETFCLPTIETTDGSLDMLPEESIFSTIEGSFPVPPPTTRRLRRDSCPPRLNSIVILEEESDDDDTSLPLTPTSDTVQDELLKKMVALDIK